MSENRNTALGLGTDSRGAVCISTNRVLDSCRDRDCFENTRVYLTEFGEELIGCAKSIRIRNAKTVSAFVGLDEVPFNCGFFQVTVRYYILIEGEACLGGGRSQTFCGIAVPEKDVILYGGEGSVTTFSSGSGTYCSPCFGKSGSNEPVAIVETVEPIVLGSTVDDCPRSCGRDSDTFNLPDEIKELLGGEVVFSGERTPTLNVSLGLFSVIRIERPVQLLVQASDYSVPDKECVSATNDENPCALFRNMAFPVAQFQASVCCDSENNSRRGQNNNGGCGCGGRGER